MPTVSPNGGQSLMDGCPWVQKDSIFALRSMSGHGICLINTNSKLQHQREGATKFFAKRISAQWCERSREWLISGEHPSAIISTQL